jgi:hypothetical protein
MRFFHGGRSPGNAGAARRDRLFGLPVTDPGLPGQLAAAFGEPPGLRRRRPVTVEVLTLGDVTGYFASQRPADPRIRAGALLSAAHPSGRLVFQVFLDEADRVCADASGAPYGRRVIARRLGDDLLDYLGGGDLLIFR